MSTPVKIMDDHHASPRPTGVRKLRRWWSSPVGKSLKLAAVMWLAGTALAWYVQKNATEAYHFEARWRDAPPVEWRAETPPTGVRLATAWSPQADEAPRRFTLADPPDASNPPRQAESKPLEVATADRARRQTGGPSVRAATRPSGTSSAIPAMPVLTSIRGATRRQANDGPTLAVQPTLADEPTLALVGPTTESESDGAAPLVSALASLKQAPNEPDTVPLEELATSEQVGQEPTPQRNNLQFLRRQTVLLEPGQWQLDAGLVYSLFEDEVPVGLFDVGGDLVEVIEGKIRQRLFYIPFEVRYGVADTLQVFANLPVGYSSSELAFVDLGQHETEDTFGIGDLNLGSSLLLREACGCSPDVILTLDMTIPTSDPDFPVLASFLPDATLGQRFWALSADLLLVHHFDPLLIFYGVGYRHLFEDEIRGIEVQPGEQISYRFGVGFAVNECVTLSTTFDGMFITETFLNNTRIPGTSLEPMHLRFAATVARGNRIVEPFVTIGLTDSAAAVQTGVVWTF